MPLPVLSQVEQRVVGSLLEKQRTVPASYPLTLNSLRLACNQSSSREPVMELSERDVQDAARALKDRGLLRLVWAGQGSRVVKYHQLLDTVIELDDEARALITVLLLRGAQSAGELKTRTERLHPFADREAVEACLAHLAEAGLVAQSAVKQGRDTRWIHLLGPITGAEAAAAVVDAETVLAEGSGARDDRVLAAYNACAAAYSQALLDELTEKPFDIWLLERIADQAGGPIMDLGCGPGQIAAFLADTGADVHGLDASPAMIEQARQNFPDLDFTVGRFHQLLRPQNAAAWGAIVAWYAFVHLAPSEWTPLLRSLAQTLRPGGTLTFAVHIGAQVRHCDELFGVPVDLDFVLPEPDQVLAWTQDAGLEIVEWYLRGPVPTEAQTRRLYVMARRPAA